MERKSLKIKKQPLSIFSILVILFIGLSYFYSNTPVNNISHITSVQTTPALSDFYKVTDVVDGDTLKVDIDGNQQTLRLIGIDTPEVVDPRKPVQCFGKEASNKAKEILTGKSVKLESDSTQSDKDKYGRLLRYIFLEDGTNFNLYMISEGYAFEYTYDIPYKYQSEFKAAQKQAEQQQKGLWSPSTCNGVHG